MDQQGADYDSFNPRARAGRDATFDFSNDPYKVSIHAPARGATMTKMEQRMLSNVSIHAPARGATETAENCVVARKVSIHAPARGATVCQESPLFSSGYNEHFDDLDSSAGKSCASSGEGSIFCFITT